MRNNSLSYAQEAWNDEQQALVSLGRKARLHRRHSKAESSESLDVQRPRRDGAAFSTEGIAMTHAQEAWNDEQGMLRRSCIGPDEQDADYTRRDVQREKMIDDDMEQAYEEVTQ